MPAIVRAMSVAVRRSPVLSGRARLLQVPSTPPSKTRNRLQTGGDYAVTTGFPEGAQQASLYVVRFSDKRLWVVPARKGAVIMRLLTISATEIVTGENPDTADPALSWQMQYLTRYDLTRLDELAAGR